MQIYFKTWIESFFPKNFPLLPPVSSLCIITLVNPDVLFPRGPSIASLENSPMIRKDGVFQSSPSNFDEIIFQFSLYAL